MRPNCFDTQEKYDTYCEYGIGNRVYIPDSEFTHDYCRDCLPEFQAKCIATDRCDHPETFFVLRKDFSGEYSCIGVSFDSVYSAQDVENHEDAVVRHTRLHLAAIDAGRMVETP